MYLTSSNIDNDHLLNTRSFSIFESVICLLIKYFNYKEFLDQDDIFSFKSISNSTAYTKFRYFLIFNNLNFRKNNGEFTKSLSSSRNGSLYNIYNRGKLSDFHFSAPAFKNFGLS